MLCRNDLKVPGYLSKPFYKNELDLSGMFFLNFQKYSSLYLMRHASFVKPSRMFHVWGKKHLLSKQVLPTFLPLAMNLTFKKRMYVLIS